jgi:hypothetical protein
LGIIVRPLNSGVEVVEKLISGASIILTAMIGEVVGH